MAKYVVYLLALIEVAALLYVGGGAALGPKSAADSGGQAMALFFFILLPLAAVIVGLAAVHFGAGRAIRGIGLALILLPLAAFVYLRVTEGAPVDDKAAFDAGDGIFAEGPPTLLARAIARADLAQVVALAPTVQINERGQYGYSFLTFAMVQPSIDNQIVAALLNAGADPNGTNSNPVTDTAFAGDAVRLNMLLDAGADPNPKGATGEPAMFSMMESPAMMRILLQRGAKVNATDRNGWTLAMAATRDGHWPAVTVLLDSGADLLHKAPDGKDLMAVIADAVTTAEANGETAPLQLAALKARVAGSAATR